MIRLANANRIVRESHQGHNRVLNLARVNNYNSRYEISRTVHFSDKTKIQESRRQNLLLNSITDQALEVGSRLSKFLLHAFSNQLTVTTCPRPSSAQNRLRKPTE